MPPSTAMTRILISAPVLIEPGEMRLLYQIMILKYLDGKIAKWWMPDDVQFVDAIPHGATGKILKTALRKQFEGYKLPTA